jgi:hypothetical protein
MICNHCGKEHSLVYPESVNTRLRKKMICIECERWFELFDENQINPAHLIVNGVYLIIDPKPFMQINHTNFLAYVKVGIPYPLYTNSVIIVGKIPKAFEGYFVDNAESIDTESGPWENGII